MTQESITLTLTGKINYEHQITMTQAVQLLAYLNPDSKVGEINTSNPDGGSGVVSGVHLSEGDDPKGASGSRNGGGPTTPREALDMSGSKTNSEKIVALGQYLTEAGDSVFKLEDVKKEFRKAREAVPGNFSRDLNGALRQGWLAEDENGDYYVTNRVQGMFGGDFKFPKSMAKAKGNGTRGSSKGPREKPEAFGAIDEFPTRMAGFPPYPTLKSEGARLLWVLAFAKGHGIKGLKNRDVAWLTDHLGVGVPSGNVGGAVRGRKAAGHLNQSTADQTLRITDSGEEYLKAYGGGDS